MSKLTKEARGQQCMIRLPGCNYNPETTVLAHINGGGMGTKHNDLHGAWACHKCHRLLDHGGADFTWTELKLAHLEGMVRTQMALMDLGYEFIKVRK